jgi:hypothetical protein
MRTTALTYEAFATPVTATNVLRYARNLALFAAAPFIGLVYVLAFPLVGAVALAWVGFKALRNAA